MSVMAWACVARRTHYQSTGNAAKKKLKPPQRVRRCHVVFRVHQNREQWFSLCPTEVPYASETDALALDARATDHALLRAPRAPPPSSDHPVGDQEAPAVRASRRRDKGRRGSG